MITIERDYKHSPGNTFKVKVSEPGMGWRGYSAQAKDLREVQLALQHYFNQKGNRHPESKCPFCRMAAEEAHRRAKTRRS